MRKKPIEYKVTERGCHECTSHSKNPDGYVMIQIGGRAGRKFGAHRLIYENHYGEIPGGMVVRHKCDNRSCINPNHLELGTHNDNMNDMAKRGRSLKGVRNKKSKLTEQHVLEIRRDRESSNTQLAKMYGVTHQLISKIRKGYVWQDVS